ncbi:hypothetical protein ASPVEDRAFT_508385 [Aspergillus versicolor CBS 583.65]|uniref:NADH:ubiquinone oxidoreductase intermediate-associated protein 30 domain-containing protein n=1 Tax=Aspergillus versicolor CBS 583.65 TaxID=1036611 RepID=A0A1L9PCX9_ASPVE|nr:uncharacterized protein ASPVEDRAFT_508385 [Aspergillus versicolor CBS 583.65]OJI99315.1 hypothetical protein ASPVEDRAFT_508385 [Aspergillus versicolor CBS 583.65]
MAQKTTNYLFGGTEKWSPNDWTSSDDRVRGGSSHSTLEILPETNHARFQGNLDIDTLGGAGFASQRTTGSRRWDLSAYDGIELDLAESDGKQYALILKDDLLPPRPDGRERSSLSWQADFRVVGSGKVVVRWEDFRPTYRGKEIDEEPLDLKSIKRLGIMMRSHFGSQSGAFNLSIGYIAAWKDEPEEDKNE